MQRPSSSEHHLVTFSSLLFGRYIIARLKAKWHQIFWDREMWATFLKLYLCRDQSVMEMDKYLENVAFLPVIIYAMATS